MLVRLRSLRVQRIGKLTARLHVWRYVPLYSETLHRIAANGSITRPRVGFGFQVGRLALQITYDK